jgi:hypothetical protein
LPGRPPIEGRADWGGESGFQPRGEVLNLTSEEDRAVGAVVGWAERRTQYLREWVAAAIMVIFIVANGATLWIVLSLVGVDQHNIASKLITPADRVITNQVIMTLLGATAVQVGAIAAIIAQYLFPGR